MPTPNKSHGIPPGLDVAEFSRRMVEMALSGIEEERGFLRSILADEPPFAYLLTPVNLRLSKTECRQRLADLSRFEDGLSRRMAPGSPAFDAAWLLYSRNVNVR
jgi:hypothetical protein